MALTVKMQLGGPQRISTLPAFGGEESIQVPSIQMLSKLPKHLLEALNTQRQDSSLCDVAIVTNDGHTYHAHKAVLSANSQYLENELAFLDDYKNKDKKTEAVINLGMITSECCEILLDLLYTSELRLTRGNVAEVLLAAEVLDLEPVSRICREFLRSRIVSKPLIKDNDSEEVFKDVNNNRLSGSDVTNDDFRRSGGYQRTGSEDSLRSSSGVSSVESELSSKDFSEQVDSPSGSDYIDVESVDAYPEATRKRPSSLSAIPHTDKYSTDKNRPGSAPSLQSNGSSNFSICLDASHSEPKKEFVFSHNDQNIHSQPVEGSVTSPTDVSSKSSLHCGKPIEHSTGIELPQRTSTNCSKAMLHDPSNTHNGKCQPYKAEFYEGCQDTKSTNFKVKGEVQVALDSIKNYQFFSDVAGGHRDTKTLSNHTNQNFKDVKNAAFCPTSSHKSIPYYSLPIQKRRSYDSAFQRPVRISGDDITTSSSRTKSDSSEDIVPPLIPSSNFFPPQGVAPDMSSFWASLYMLQSQSVINQAGALGTPNSPTNGIQSQPFSLHYQNTSRHQLQHSKSIMASSSSLCNLCGLEFTSDWALSIHHQFSHPMGYLYPPAHGFAPTTFHHEMSEKQPDNKMKIEHEESVLPVTDHSRKFAAKKNPQMDVTKDFSKGMLGLFNNHERKMVHKCYHCKKEFASIFLLRKHKSAEHVKRPFQCHRCDSAFPNKAGLSVHLRSHTGERPYQCKICKKAFTQLGHVQRHQKVHTGEKPYQCPLCQARVRDKASMHYHILAHQGVKPFQCDQCDARFTKRSSLVKHKNVHTGSFLYQCSQCKASFREKASLSRHVRSQHKDPSFTVASERPPSQPISN